jgi:type I restriction enzyme S subunit
MKLSEVCMNRDAKRRPVKKSGRTSGTYPFYGASGIIDYVDGYLFDGEFLLVSEDGANLVARNTPIAFSVNGKTWVNNHAHVLEFSSRTTQKFVEIYLNSIDLSKYIATAAQPKLSQESLNNILIPMPEHDVQERVVSILGKFEAIISNVKIGLPAEIAARRKQYEYYRDKLLTFKEAA